MVIYCVFFMITPIFDYKYIYLYIDNFNIHFIFQFFYETIFVLFISILFYPKELPPYYFDEIIFNYKVKVFLLANISEKENNISKKLNISNLSFNVIKNFYKKDNYPIVLLNPYTYEKKNSLFEEIYIGIAQKY